MNTTIQKIEPPPLPTVRQAHVKEIARTFVQTYLGAKKSAEQELEIANTFLENGILLQGVCGHMQIKFSVYEGLKGDVNAEIRRLMGDNAIEWTYWHAKAAVKVANSTTKKFETHKEAKEAIQGAFEIGGFIEIPSRTGPQKSHDVAPSVCIFMALASAKEKIEKRIFDLDSWSGFEASRVRSDIERHEKWLAEIKSKLPEPEKEAA